MDTTKYQNGLKHKASRRMKRAAFLSELLRFFYRGHESGEEVGVVQIGKSCFRAQETVS